MHDSEDDARWNAYYAKVFIEERISELADRYEKRMKLHLFEKLANEALANEVEFKEAITIAFDDSVETEILSNINSLTRLIAEAVAEKNVMLELQRNIDTDY